MGESEDKQVHILSKDTKWTNSLIVPRFGVTSSKAMLPVPPNSPN